MFKRTIWPILCGILSTLICVAVFIAYYLCMSEFLSSVGVGVGAATFGAALLISKGIVSGFINLCTSYDNPPIMGCARKAKQTVYIMLILCILAIIIWLSLPLFPDESFNFTYLSIYALIASPFFILLIKKIFKLSNKEEITLTPEPVSESFEDKLAKYSGRPVVANEKEEKPDIYTTVAEGSIEDKFAKAKAAAKANQKE